MSSAGTLLKLVLLVKSLIDVVADDVEKVEKVVVSTYPDKSTYNSG